MGTTQILRQDNMHLLFRGNPSAYGMDEGPGTTPRAVREPVSDALFNRHFDYHDPFCLGIYPMWEYDGDGGWVCRWGCADIDTGDLSEVRRLCVALRSMEIPYLIERSRSKGWHIWVFAQDWVPCWTMRRMFQVAYKAAELVAKEINPKAEKLKSGQLGNFVRLPWCDGPNQDYSRNLFVDEDDRELEDGVMVVFASNAHLRKWALKWVEPEKKSVSIRKLNDKEIQKVADSLPERLRKFLLNGPVGNGDRSAGLTKFAYLLKDAGYSDSERYHLLTLADQRWGKYYDRPDGDVYIQDLVERTVLTKKRRKKS